jgi:hypothetical protein
MIASFAIHVLPPHALCATVTDPPCLLFSCAWGPFSDREADPHVSTAAEVHLHSSMCLHGVVLSLPSKD